MNLTTDFSLGAPVTLLAVIIAHDVQTPDRPHAALIRSVFVGCVLGQRDVRSVSGAPYSGDDFGFRAEGQAGNPAEPGRGWVTGKFVVMIDGR